MKNTVNEVKSSSGEELLYKLDGKPPLKYAIPIGLQHVFAMFTGNLAPLLIVTKALNANNPGSVSDAEVVVMVQAAILMSGIATLLQVLPIKIGKKFQIGANLPLVVGTSFAFVPIALSVGAKYGLPGIFGAAIVGGIVEFLMGILVSPLKRVFQPIVVGCVLVTIGLNLMPTGINYFAGGAGSPNFGSIENLALGFTVFLIITVINRFGKGMVKNLGILIGIAVGYILAIIMGMVDFTPVAEASWFSFPLPGITPEFHIEAIISVSAIYIIAGLETMGNMSGITIATMNREATSQENSGGIIANSLTSIMGALLNTFPNSAFGQNAGLVSVSKIINRFAIGTGAVIMIVIGFVPKISALFSAMPSSVLGGAVITVFAIIFLNGVKMLAKAGFSANNIQVLSITFGLGYGLGIVPEATEKLPDPIHFIFSEPVLSVCVIAIIANLVFNGIAPKEEKNATEEVKATAEAK